MIWYRLKTDVAQPVTLTVFNAAQKAVATLPVSKKAGLHQAIWNLEVDGQKAVRVQPGNYTIGLQVGDRRVTKILRVDAEEGGAK